MSQGLEAEIVLMARNYESVSGRSARFLVCSHDEHRRIRTMAMERLNRLGYFRSEQSEKILGLEIALVQGTSKLVVVG